MAQAGVNWPKAAPDLLGPLETVTPPPDTLAQALLPEARTHCRVDADAEDALLLRLLRAAAEYAEDHVPGTRQLVTATYSLPVARWWLGPLKLPRPPLQQVNAVTYLDTAGALQTFAPGGPQGGPGQPWPSPFRWWYKTPRAQPGYLEVFANQTLPVLWPWTEYAVFVNFTCGYPTVQQVPSAVVQAMLLLAGTWYENREDATPLPLRTVPRGVDDLLATAGWGSYR